MVDIEANRSIEISNNVNSAIANWTTDGRNQL